MIKYPVNRFQTLPHFGINFNLRPCKEEDRRQRRAAFRAHTAASRGASSRGAGSPRGGGELSGHYSPEGGGGGGGGEGGGGMWGEGSYGGEDSMYYPMDEDSEFYDMGYDYAAQEEAEEVRIIPPPLLTARMPAVLTADLLGAAERLAAARGADQLNIDRGAAPRPAQAYSVSTGMYPYPRNAGDNGGSSMEGGASYVSAADGGEEEEGVGGGGRVVSGRSGSAVSPRSPRPLSNLSGSFGGGRPSTSQPRTANNGAGTGTGGGTNGGGVGVGVGTGASGMKREGSQQRVLPPHVQRTLSLRVPPPRPATSSSSSSSFFPAPGNGNGSGAGAAAEDQFQYALQASQQLLPVVGRCTRLTPGFRS